MKRAQSLLTAALLATGLATGLAGAAIAASEVPVASTNVAR